LRFKGINLLTKGLQVLALASFYLGEGHNMKKLGVLLVLFAFSGGVAPAQTHPDIQQLVLNETPTAFYATLPVFASVDHSVPGQEQKSGIIVIGTGFVVNNQGDFITAAHVASTTEVGTGADKVKVRLTVGRRQKTADISGTDFKVVEIDSDHDLALCHIDFLRGVTFAETGVQKIAHPEQPGGFTAEQMSQPFASLAIDLKPPQAGRFILVSGFPLGSWTPAIQFGLLSATENIYPNAPIGRLPKDTGQLLQISVSANHGNSGGPVIDLSSGRVVGVILSIVPAPLAIDGKQVWGDQGYDMSGIMLAAPAKWVNALLSRHNVKSESIKEGKLFWGFKHE
jgi:S1-C subfamily serine protease